MNPTTTHDTTHDTDATAKLALLWDIDGPLYPCEAKPHRRPQGYLTHRLRPEGHEEGRLNERGRYVKALRIWLNPDHGPKILKLADDLGAENWWATTWRHEANRLIGPLIGLPELPTLFTDVPTTYPEWKWPHVLAAFPDRPLIWFDDDFNESWNIERRDAFLRARGDTPTLLHYVDPRVGLRDEDFDTARDWATALAGRTP